MVRVWVGKREDDCAAGSMHIGEGEVVWWVCLGRSAGVAAMVASAVFGYVYRSRAAYLSMEGGGVDTGGGGRWGPRVVG